MVDCTEWSAALRVLEDATGQTRAKGDICRLVRALDCIRRDLESDSQPWWREGDRLRLHSHLLWVSKETDTRELSIHHLMGVEWT